MKPPEDDNEDDDDYDCDQYDNDGFEESKHDGSAIKDLENNSRSGLKESNRDLLGEEDDALQSEMYS